MKLKIAILLLFVFSAYQAKADELKTTPSFFSRLHLLEGDYAGFEAGQIKHLRDPYMPEYTTTSKEEEHWKSSAALLGDINWIRYGDFRLFMKNRWHMTTTNHQVRHVGWQYELGATLVPGSIDLFYRHHSQHVLESTNMDSRFPLLDEYVIQVHLYKRK